MFKTDTMFNSHVQYKGVGGRDMYFDPGFNPWLHVRRYGEVVQIPQRLGKMPIALQVPQGIPQYYENAPYTFKMLDDIEPEVREGDRLYFHHNTVNLRNLIREEGEYPNRTYYFRVRYDQIMCVVREVGKSEVDESLSAGDPEDTKYKVIIPIGSWTLIVPDYESWDDILVKTYSHLIDKEGNKILKPKDEWIQKKSAPGYKFLKGYVRHIGSPFRGDLCYNEEGDQILYQRNADYSIEVEGNSYFAIRQRHIMGKFAKEA
jgi:hypothetical protein